MSELCYIAECIIKIAVTFCTRHGCVSSRLCLNPNYPGVLNMPNESTKVQAPCQQAGIDYRPAPGHTSPQLSLFI